MPTTKTKTGVFLLAVMTASLTALALIEPVLGGSSLIVTWPPDLANAFATQYPPNGDIPDTPAMFGIPFYYLPVNGVVRRAHASDPNTPPDRVTWGCGPISTDGWPDPSLGSTVILMIDRGNCSFAAKVRNCQNAGAVACIIVDQSGIPRNQPLPIMGDDGTGKSLITPSMIIHQADGQIIYTELSTNHNDDIILQLTFTLPNPDGNVQWEYWTSSNDPPPSNGHEFKHTFGEAAKLLDGSHTFIPRYLVIDGSWPGYSCVSLYPRCGRQCTNHGRYCAVDPEGDLSKGLDGEDVIFENMRQMCVYEYLNRTNQGVKWWDYVSQFTDICSKNDASWTANCSNVILTNLGIPAPVIDACITKAGGFGNNVNDHLAAMITLRQTEGIFKIPMLVVNNEIYYGSMECPTPIQFATCGPLQAICAGFAPGTQPPACTGDSGCPVGVKRDVCAVCGGTITNIDDCNPEPPRSGVSLGIVVAVSVAGLAVLGGGIFCYVRRNRSETRRDVTNLLRQYVPLDVDPETMAKMQREKAAPLSGADDAKTTTSINKTTGQVERHQLLSQHDDSAAAGTASASASGVSGALPPAPAPVDEL